MNIELPTDADPVKVIHGDSLSLLDSIDPSAVSIVITDPPYGVSLDAHSQNLSMDGTSRKRKRDIRIANDGDTAAAEAVFSWASGHKLPIVAFGSPYRPYPGEWRNILVWDKGPAVGGGGDPSKCWKRTFELIYTRRTSDLRVGRDESVLRFPVNTGSDFEYHPCQKPLPLLRYLILQLTDPGDTILDPFGGSGATAVAALREGRKCIVIEQEARYVEIIKKRLWPKGELFS